MIVVFSGWGIVLVPLFGIIGIAIPTGLRILTWGSGKIDSHTLQPWIGIYSIMGGIAAGALCWIVGRKLNVKRTLIDQATGQAFVFGRRHSLMFIPVEYYAFVYPVLFACLGFV